ncbi:hypothetical protein JB92DRAFT_3107013 [Gautieria morchelliformis]|nr:hypothetical protein JB92DRAFT_3107013 [Gautieria morchelliformis]
MMLGFGEGPIPALQPSVIPQELSEPQSIIQPMLTKRRPMFLSSNNGDNTPTPTPKKPRTGSPRAVLSPSIEVAEADKIRQSVVKQEYPEDAFLLGWKIFIGPEIIMKPAKCRRCLHYGHTCSGQAGKMCGRCIRDRQGCVSPKEYEANEEKDAQEAKAKEWNMKVKAKGKVKDKGVIPGCPPN